MAKTHLEKTLTALAGEFLVAGHLCLKGFVASLTLKNYPGVDIFCLNPGNRKQVAIQVKTARGHGSYYVPEDVDKLDNPFIFVHIDSDESVEFYIVPSTDVASLSDKERKDYLQTHPAARREQPRMVNLKNLADYRDRWDLLDLQ
jgi:hypothetical protein